MNLTKEQSEIIQSTGNIRINAVAGSGKTTTLIEYARSRPAISKILYLAFNRSVKLEATKKFADTGLVNVVVETAHSLAFKFIVQFSNYKVKSLGYKINEIVELLQLKGNEEKHTEYIIANHIIKLVAYFCNSDKQKVQELNYLDTITDTKAKAFVEKHYDYIILHARIFLSKMDKGEIEITHDFYLKKFQLSTPILNFDYILFDEGQDASPAMLAIFLNQTATKIIVGDTHQQIYSWRYAINSLEKVNFTIYNLTGSFRFNKDIADLATGILDNKKLVYEKHKEVSITGLGNNTSTKSKAIIARTNLGLLLKAIEYVTEQKRIKRIYFEGNFNSYTYADDGASLYDVLNLYNLKQVHIKDQLIKSMKNISELEDYIEKTEDVQLAMMVEIVKEYGNEIPKILKIIKDKHVSNDEKENAEIIFTTTHRCKGMEYDEVYLVNDFITDEKLNKYLKDKQNLNRTKINEEINLLYVAITRTKNKLKIPEELIPSNLNGSLNVQIIKSKPNNNASKDSISKKFSSKTVTVKENALGKIRDTHKEAYKPWTWEQDRELTEMYFDGVSLDVLARYFERTKGAILSRINKLELDEFNDDI